MIQASKDELEMELQASFAEIRRREMVFYTNNCRALGTQAALFAAFAYSAISVELPRSSSHALKGVYLTFATSAMGFAFTSMINSMMASMLGPGYALRGPEGSYHHATESMMYEYKLVAVNLLLSMNMFYFAAFAYIFLVFGLPLSLPLFFVMALAYERTVSYSLSVLNRFRLPTGLAISGRINTDGTITPYTALSPIKLELDMLRRRPRTLVGMLRRRWLEVRIELDEFLGTSDLRDADSARVRTDADISADAEVTRVSMQNMLYNIEHGDPRATQVNVPLYSGDSSSVNVAHGSMSIATRTGLHL
jgi:hypothetical protein